MRRDRLPADPKGCPGGGAGWSNCGGAGTRTRSSAAAVSPPVDKHLLTVCCIAAAVSVARGSVPSLRESPCRRQSAHDASGCPPSSITGEYCESRSRSATGAASSTSSSRKPARNAKDAFRRLPDDATPSPKADRSSASAELRRLAPSVLWRRAASRRRSARVRRCGNDHGLAGRSWYFDHADPASEEGGRRARYFVNF